MLQWTLNIHVRRESAEPKDAGDSLVYSSLPNVVSMPCQRGMSVLGVTRDGSHFPSSASRPAITHGLRSLCDAFLLMIQQNTGIQTPKHPTALKSTT